MALTCGDSFFQIGAFFLVISLVFPLFIIYRCNLCHKIEGIETWSQNKMLQSPRLFENPIHNAKVNLMLHANG